MNIDKLSKEELELYSHKDLTYMIIKESGPMNTADLPNSFYENKIGDYYTTLTTDKRFILLDDGNWDLKEKYSSDKVKKDLDDEELEDDDEDQEEVDDEIEQENDEDEDSFDSTVNDDDFDDSDDDYKDLVIIDEDEMELEE